MSWPYELDVPKWDAKDVRSYWLPAGPYGCSHRLGVLFAGVLKARALLFWAPDSCKLPYLSTLRLSEVLRLKRSPGTSNAPKLSWVRGFNSALGLDSYYTRLYHRECYAMLCYAMLCYAMLCYAMLCYAMLCYAMLCYAMLCYAILYCTILYYTKLNYICYYTCYTILYYTTLS